MKEILSKDARKIIENGLYTKKGQKSQMFFI